MRDFTLDTYKQLLLNIKAGGYSFQNVKDFVTNPTLKVVILRHDSDIWPENDLKMAVIEKELGINATYYFRVPATYNIDIIKSIHELEHEIGYHYEDLARFNGDFPKAIESFGKNLEKIRKNFDVKTVSMHGRPLSKWDSRDLWKRYSLSDFGIVCEPYLNIDYNKVLYLTENGSRWDGDKSNVRDKVKSDYKYDINTTFDLIKRFQKNELPDQIILNIHPARWNDNLLVWTYRFLLQKMKNVAKRVLNKMIRDN